VETDDVEPCAYDASRPRQFRWQLVAAVGCDLVSDLFAAASEAAGCVRTVLIAHEKYHDQVADAGRQIEALTADDFR